MSNANTPNLPPRPVATKLVGEHIEGCWAKELYDNNELPTPWNVLQMHPVRANQQGDLMTWEEVEQAGVSYYFVEMSCACRACGAIKRVSMHSISEL